MNEIESIHKLLLLLRSGIQQTTDNRTTNNN
jgi:hypothetical protein